MAPEVDSSPVEVPSPRRFLILGTAGHIDHGKTALVKALTGIDTDRLPQEKARGMTIELGFAHFQVDDIRFGIVDVPGHERFVRRMVAGATGISVALLVVAADDGVMPQTEEHALILDLLGVQRGVVAITKCDLVDQARVNEVAQDVEILLAGLSLENSPIVAVSSVTGQGLDELSQALTVQARDAQAAKSSGLFRLGVDRVFTIHGRGTVVTGSVLGGSAHPAETLELLPAGLRCRVRELQVHGQAADAIESGQRAALNLAGVQRDQIARGDEIATPGYLTPSRHLDGRLRSLRGGKAIKSFTRVRLAMSTWEEMATVVALHAGTINPGESALVQFRLKRPVAASFGQRFILRDETASRTIGGGRILRPVSHRLSARQTDDVLGLSRMESDDPLERIGEVLRFAAFQPLSTLQLACRTGVEPDEVAKLLKRLASDGVLIPLPGLERHVHRGGLAALAQRARQRLKAFHERRPNEVGIHVDSFVGWLNRRAASGLGRAILDILVDQRHVHRRAEYICDPDFAPTMSDQDRLLLEQIAAELHETGLQPPGVNDLRVVRGQKAERVLRVLEIGKAEGSLVEVSEKLWFHAEHLEQLKQAVRSTITDQGPATVSQIKSKVDLTRKHMVPLLEYLDRIGFTRRLGDKRVLVERT